MKVGFGGEGDQKYLREFRHDGVDPLLREGQRRGEQLPVVVRDAQAVDALRENSTSAEK